MTNTTQEIVDEFLDDIQSDGFISESRNGSHQSKKENPRDIAELIRALGENGMITPATTRIVGTRMR